MFKLMVVAVVVLALALVLHGCGGGDAAPTVVKPLLFYTDRTNTSTVAVDLTTKLSTEAERGLFEKTCDPESELYFPWFPENSLNQFVCNSSSPKFWLAYARTNTPKLAKLVDAGKVYKTEWAALFAQGSWYQAASIGRTLYDYIKGTEQVKPFPSNFRIPLILVSSGLTRQRTMSAEDIKSLYTDGAGVLPQDVLDNRSDANKAVTQGLFNESMLLFRGASVGTHAHKLAYCNDENHHAGYEWRDASLSSTTLDLSRAVDIYARTNGTLSLWLLNNFGYQDFSGETEFLPAVGVQLRQMACDISTDGFVPKGTHTTIHAVSFAYEISQGTLSADQEAELLQKMRKVIYGDRIHVHRPFQTSEYV